MSWESTAHYYAHINRNIRTARGGLHSAPLLLHSVDFALIADMQRAGNWTGAAQLLGQAGKGLAAAGAGALLICTNTMHKVADEVAAIAGLPLLHITDPTIAALQRAGVSKVGLIGTRFTMEDDFYTARLQGAGLQVCVPDAPDRAEVHRVIFEELCLGQIVAASRQRYLAVIDALHADGAQAVILGCTEIAMLVSQADTGMPLLDTTALHADAAVQWLLQDS
jgi:aspartate racemase